MKAPPPALLCLAALVCSVGCRVPPSRVARPLTAREAGTGTFALRTPRLEAVVMVPDQPSSCYAGQRFESGGVVLQVTLDGRHTFMGKEPRGERLGGCGLIEEIGISGAVGYEEAKPGEPFLKLGVGLLKRPDAPRYSFFKPHEEIGRFPWRVTVGPRSATFLQVGTPLRGTACRYEKRIVLDPAEPILRIEHALTNTGTKPIISTQYCHNFLRFGDAAPGPGYVVEMPFPLEVRREPTRMTVAGNRLLLPEFLTKPAYGQFEGEGSAAHAHRFRVAHEGNGLEMTISGDFPMAYMAYYADREAISPEAFCALNIQPGETFRWTRTYTFAARN